MAEPFSFRQAERLRKVLSKHKIRYLFIGKSGAIILGYPDSTQDTDLFVEKSMVNCASLVKALKEISFKIMDTIERDILRGKDFIQLRNGPFDLDLIFAPDGIENFDAAWKRHVTVKGYPVCHPDDIIKSKEKANRLRDREALPRLKAFRDYWRKNR